VHAVLLPMTAHLLRLPNPPARALIDAGVPVCIATDFNPNAFSLDLPASMGLACVDLRLTMAEALVAATINAASALGLAESVGSLEVSKENKNVSYCIKIHSAITHPKTRTHRRGEYNLIFVYVLCVSDTKFSR
jgi:alpha-D-ribose 1-methylphosphonate 5-triphosphate diphosphatase PhnM